VHGKRRKKEEEMECLYRLTQDNPNSNPTRTFVHFTTSIRNTLCWVLRQLRSLLHDFTIGNAVHVNWEASERP
jgi:hypothetical protein